MANGNSPVEVYSPDGVRGTIPPEQITQAIAAGYKPKDAYVEAVHPTTGQTGIIPKEQWGAAQKQGFTLSPMEQARAATRRSMTQGNIDKTFPGTQKDPLSQTLMNMTLARSGQQAQASPITQAGMEQGQAVGTKAGFETIGGAVGGEFLGPALGLEGLNPYIQAMGRGSAIGAGMGLGNVIGQLGTTGRVSGGEALGTAAAGTAGTAAIEGISGAVGFGKRQIAKLAGETPERIAELKGTLATEQKIATAANQAEVQSRTAFKNAYDEMGIDAAPVNMTAAKNAARQAAELLPKSAAPVPRPVASVAGLPEPAEANLADYILSRDNPTEILAALSKSDTVPFRQAQQVRTAIEQYISKAKPPAQVYNAMKNVSNSIGSELEVTAGREGKLPQLKNADAMFKQHADDFWNKNAPLKPWTGSNPSIKPDMTGKTLNRFLDTAQQGRALEAIERRLGPQPELRAILSKGKGPALRDIRDAATLQNLGQPALNQQVGAANRAALSKTAGPYVKGAAGAAIGTGIGGGLYELYKYLRGKGK